MKLSTILTAALLVSAPGAIAHKHEHQHKHHRLHCEKHKSHHVAKAIKKFCSKTDIVVPSKYANKGQYSGPMFVAITGDCSPPQWVPQEYCFSQFWKMCSSGGSNGQNEKHFGKDGCQTWIIPEKNKDGFIKKRDSRNESGIIPEI